MEGEHLYNRRRYLTVALSFLPFHARHLRMKIPPSILARYRTIHSWVGISCGSLLAMAFLAGTLTLFAAPLQQWSLPRFSAHAVMPSSIPLEDLPIILDKVRENNPLTSQTNFKNLSLAHYILTLSSPTAARLYFPTDFEIPLGLSPDKVVVNLKTASAEPELHTITSSAVPTFIGGLHRRMGLPLPENWAMPAVALICLLYGLALLSGVVLIFPGIWRNLMNIRPHGHIRRFWLDLHSLLGLCNFPFHLIIALTSALFALYPLLYGTSSTSPHAPFLPPSSVIGTQQTPPPAHTTQKPRHVLAPLTILTKLQTFEPSFHPMTMEYVLAGTTTKRPSPSELHAPLYSPNRPWVPTSQQAYLFVRGTDRHYPLMGRDNGSILLDPYSGTPLYTANLPGHQNLERHILTWCLALHFGSFGGEFTRWLYATLGIAGVVFFYTANQLWINARRRKSPQHTHLIDTPTTARLTQLSDGTLLGCLLGVCTLILCSPLLAHITPLSSPHSPSYLFTIKQSYQFISWLYYGIVGLTLLSCFLFPLRLCRITILWASMLCLEGAVILNFIQKGWPHSRSSCALDILFTMLSIGLGFTAWKLQHKRSQTQ